MDLSNLNEPQRQAVLHGRGPLLLLAGAGSGKTRVVTTRIARLLEQGERPDSILALTFTNKAAREMRERVAVLAGGHLAPGLVISTFHALGAWFLRHHAELLGRTSQFTIYDDDDQRVVIKDALLELGISERLWSVRSAQWALDKAKNAGRELQAEDLPPEAIMAGGLHLGPAYEKRLARADAFDFGDLIVRPGDLLESDEWLRQGYQKRWRWMLVDEFQDTNAAQYRWLRLLAPPDANLFVVGDDDQSIYSWRGAEVENILQFPRDYPGAVVLKLEQNYRSTGYILKAANEMIRHNERRLGKALWTAADDGWDPLESTCRHASLSIL